MNRAYLLMCDEQTKWGIVTRIIYAYLDRIIANEEARLYNQKRTNTNFFYFVQDIELKE